MMEIRKAVKAGEQLVKLGDKTFLIRYAGDHFFIRPQDGFAPCAWMHLETVKKGQF